MRSLSLSKPRSVFVFDLVEPERHLCERGTEVVHRGALLIAWAVHGSLKQYCARRSWGDPHARTIPYCCKPMDGC
jgi:hypothetical protein